MHSTACTTPHALQYPLTQSAMSSILQWFLHGFLSTHCTIHSYSVYHTPYTLQ
jgi:hypothetical protein